MSYYSPQSVTFWQHLQFTGKEEGRDLSKGCCYVRGPSGSFRSAALRTWIVNEQKIFPERAGRGMRKMGEGPGSTETGKESADSTGIGWEWRRELRNSVWFPQCLSACQPVPALCHPFRLNPEAEFLTENADVDDQHRSPTPIKSDRYYLWDLLTL